MELDNLLVIEWLGGNAYASIVFFVRGVSKLLNCVLIISEQYINKSADAIYGANSLTGILSSS
jgi:hypothetical protein